MHKYLFDEGSKISKTEITYLESNRDGLISIYFPKSTAN